MPLVSYQLWQAVAVCCARLSSGYGNMGTVRLSGVTCNDV